MNTDMLAPNLASSVDSDKPDPSLVMALILNVEPRLVKLKALMELPNRIPARILIPLPIDRKSTIETFPPLLTEPNKLKPLPDRAKFLMLSEEPICV
jgi:hypothetical protein